MAATNLGSELSRLARGSSSSSAAAQDQSALSKSGSSGGGSRARALRQRAAAAARHPAGRAALTVAASYLAVRAATLLFQRTRRLFLRQLLKDLCPALDAIGQPYWIDFGALLGLHRGGDIILHDNDVDLAVLNPDWPALLEGLRRELPPKYSVKVVTPADSPASSWVRVYTALGMADLFGAHDEGGNSIAVDCGHGDLMHIDKDLVLPTGHKEWRGCSLSVPRDVEGTLVRRYGPDWRTPRYLDKGADTVEGSKPYARLMRALARLGIRV